MVIQLLLSRLDFKYTHEVSNIPMYGQLEVKDLLAKEFYGWS